MTGKILAIVGISVAAVAVLFVIGKMIDSRPETPEKPE